ncbi:putative immunity protein [Cryobacterium sp. Y29]|uniref:putative immunity protein n=1 Tax=Cryobacterium sp. Y29 TaxID=2048285 RepID=UPI00351A1B3E
MYSALDGRGAAARPSETCLPRNHSAKLTRRLVARWAADCAERVLVFFDSRTPSDTGAVPKHLVAKCADAVPQGNPQRDSPLVVSTRRGSR